MRILAWIPGAIAVLLVVATGAAAQVLSYDSACEPGATPPASSARMLAIRSPSLSVGR